MQQAINLFDKALADYNAAKKLRALVGPDEEELNIVAYLLQQSLELTMKYILEMNGIEYPKAHDIETLSRFARQNHVNLMFTEYIDEHQEMFSQWEAKTRYVLGYLTEVTRIDRAIEELGTYLKVVSEAMQ